MSKNLLTSDIIIKREKKEEKVSQNVSFLASVKAHTDMSDCILSCSLNTIDKSEHHISSAKSI